MQLLTKVDQTPTLRMHDPCILVPAEEVLDNRWFTEKDITASEYTVNVLEIILHMDDMDTFSALESFESIINWNSFESQLKLWANVSKVVIQVVKYSTTADVEERIIVVHRLIEELTKKMKGLPIDVVGLINVQHFDVGTTFPLAKTLFLGSVKAEHIKNIKCGENISHVIFFHCDGASLNDLQYSSMNNVDKNVDIDYYTVTVADFLTNHANLKSNSVASAKTIHLHFTDEGYRFTYTKFAADNTEMGNLIEKKAAFKSFTSLRKLLEAITIIPKANQEPDKAKTHISEYRLGPMEDTPRDSFWSELGELLLKINFPINIQMQVKSDSPLDVK